MKVAAASAALVLTAVTAPAQDKAPGLLQKWKAPPEVSIAAPAKPAATAVSGKPQPLQVGAHAAFPEALLGKGKWTGKGAAQVWRLAVRSRGAAALRVHFAGFDAAAGRVWVHDGTAAFGPYTGKGQFGDGDFWSDVVPGERVVIEYQPGVAARPRALPFRVKEIAHQWQP